MDSCSQADGKVQSLGQNGHCWLLIKPKWKSLVFHQLRIWSLRPNSELIGVPVVAGGADGVNEIGDGASDWC